MIQSSYKQPIAPKASVEVKSKNKSEDKSKDLARSLESKDFDKELKAASEETPKNQVSKSKKQNSESYKTEEVKTKLPAEDSAEVKAVKVDPEMSLEKPTDLINAQSGQGEPKVFESSLIDSVESILQPETVEAGPVKLTDEQVLKLADGEARVLGVETGLKGEIAQAMLKTPQLQAGRAPAIEFAQSEIDPQLLNNEDFIAQKNLVAKKNINSSGYGINKPQIQKMAMENELKQIQIVNDVTASEANGDGALNSQQFILNMKNELNGSPKTNDLQVAPKVFDISNIKSTNSNQVMDQISNYIVQARAAKEPTVTMRVNHQELGLIDITVQKSMTVGQDAVAINIGTHSLDGKNFFQQNSKDLFAHLSSAGINVSDLKIETPSSTAKNEFDMNNQSGRQGSQEKQFGSEQNQRRHDSDRRQELWKLLTDKEAA